MYYQIYYKRTENSEREILFDIEMYIKEDEVKYKEGVKERWFVEMHSDSFLSGGVYFILDMTKKKNFNFADFKKDCADLEDLRGWLWETHINPIRSIELASKDKDEWQNIVQNKIYSFAKKYGLFVNED